MQPNDDLMRWGEPPADPAELALANLLADLLEQDRSGEPVPQATLYRLRQVDRGQELIETATWIEQTIATVVACSGILENLPPPADPGGPARNTDLRLRVSRLVSGGVQPVASTHVQPTTLRDLRRIPEDPDRVVLRTGDRVRIEVVSGRPGYVTVFNVGPRGTVNLLYPLEAERQKRVDAGVPLSILDVELMPPAGNERLYAVWTRTPRTVAQLVGLVKPGVTLRDMQRVQDALAQEPEQDWHAVMLELEHQ